VTIAQVLKAAGYRTGHFGKWHLGSVQKDGMCTPGKCGFDEWVSAPNFFDLDPVLSDRGKATEFKGDSSDITADLAVKFIRACAAKKEPFLAVVWFGSPHAPHKALPDDAKPYADRPAGEANFLGEITAMDRSFGRVRKELKDLGIADDTILWYCSDNGALPKVGNTGGRRGFKGQVYEGGLLVPALLEWPARFPKPRVIDVPCVTSDIYPTVLEWTGAKPERQPPLDGASLVPLLDGKAKARTKPIGFWDHPTGGLGTPSKEWMDELLADQKAGREPTDPKRLFADAGKITTKYPLDRFPGHSAWIDGGWKLHRIEAAKGDGVKWELYDLAADPNETRDLSATEAKRLEAMKKDLTAWLESVVRSLNGEDYPKK
jgi:arylsulfatase A-like enzyme